MTTTAESGSTEGAGMAVWKLSESEGRKSGGLSRKLKLSGGAMGWGGICLERKFVRAGIFFGR